MKKDVTTKVLIAIITGMLVGIIVLLFLLNDAKTKDKNNQKESENKIEKITSDRDNIQGKFEYLLEDYDMLETTNDSLNAEISKRKEEILQLIDEVKNTKNWAAKEKSEYEKQIKSLKEIMRHYVYQIDSLNILNQQLIAENQMVKSENTRYKSENDELADLNTELMTTIEDASVINASHISVIYLNARDKETNKADKIEKLKVTFTLSANKLATPGKKVIFLRIKRPDGYFMSSGKTFTAGDTQLSYTDSREIGYDNQAIDVSIFHKIDKATNKITTGKYEVSLYMDGNEIGKSSFVIGK